ncbi:MAG: putative protein N(5)-glutamine methyltransferase [Nocardioidaceae bacterium]|nr:putative protein N(5)-glutamine methyltransferase [Nocardioidaceae bacterium]
MLETYDDTVAQLRSAGCVFAEEEAELLLAAAAGSDVVELVRRRVAGEPLEAILGWADFAGQRILVDPGVFVPRRRTSHLAAVAAGLVAGREAPTAVDLCCGTGAIGAVLLARVPGLRLVATDLDPAAVANARRNLPGAEVVLGDLFSALPHDLRGRVDVLAVNAPYVPTRAIATMPPEARDHERTMALDGGADGLDVHRRVAADAPGWLRPGGHLVIEVGTGQVDTALGMFRDAGMVAHVEVDDDLDATVIVGGHR